MATLKQALVEAAKKASMTRDTLERAIKKGAGLLDDGATFETVTYEGFAPHQVPVIVECLTDNKNRAASEVRVAVTRHGGSMADSGSVAYLFERKGVVEVAKTDGLTEDDVLAAVLDAGAEDVNDLGDSVTTPLRVNR